MSAADIVSINMRSEEGKSNTENKVPAEKVEFHRIFCKLEERKSPAGNVFPSFYEVADGNFSFLKG